MQQPVDWRWAAATAAFLIHNAEEVIFGLPAWANAHPTAGWVATMMPEQRFVPAVIGLSIVVLALAVLGTWRPAPWSRQVLRFFAVVMLLNAASHVGLSLWTASIMPGLWTALILLLPVLGWIAIRPPARRHAPSTAGHAP